jgi:hypothetical protein
MVTASQKRSTRSWRTAGRTHRCRSPSDTSELQCSQTGFYGTYLVPSVIKHGSDVTITYTMSSFSPYNVALFQTTFSQ